MELSDYIAECVMAYNMSPEECMVIGPVAEALLERSHELELMLAARFPANRCEIIANVALASILKLREGK